MLHFKGSQAKKFWNHCSKKGVYNHILVHFPILSNLSTLSVVLTQAIFLSWRCTLLGKKVCSGSQPARDTPPGVPWIQPVKWILKSWKDRISANASSSTFLLRGMAHSGEVADADARWGVLRLNKQERSDYECMGESHGKREKEIWRQECEEGRERDFDDPHISLPVSEKLLIC